MNDSREVTERDYSIILDALTNNDDPNQALRDAYKRYLLMTTTSDITRCKVSYNDHKVDLL